jgi:hypothetical protein
MNIKKTRAGRPRRLASCLMRRRADSVAALPIDQLVSSCFGPVGKSDRLALADFIAGQEGLGYGPSPERSHGDGTDPTELRS